MDTSSSDGRQDEPAEGSKKHDMSRLPRDWRARMLATVQGRKLTRPSQLPDAIAALWATGCRPAELEKGLQISVEKGWLMIVIRGSKHGEIDNGQVVAQRGMEWRALYFRPDDSDATRHLADRYGDGEKHQLIYDKNSLRTRVNELGREVLANLKNPPSLSPYSFRHAMGADLKSCDEITDTDRAQVMGHLSIESLQTYGRRRRGGRGLKPVRAVKASAQPHGTRTHAPPTKPPKPAKASRLQR
jgi:integrase